MRRVTVLRNYPMYLGQENNVNSIICIKDTKENLKHCFELIKDTLLLIPEELELGIIVKEIRSKLDKVI